MLIEADKRADKYALKLKPKDSLEKIIVIQLQKNIGVASALNLGISKSVGKYICYLNNDVIVTKQWLEGLVRACKENTNNAIVGTLFNAFENKQFILNRNYVLYLKSNN